VKPALGNPPELRTRRLLLSPVSPDDATDLELHWGEPGVRLYPWDDRAPLQTDVDAVVARSEADFRRSSYGLWAVRLADESQLAGVCGVRNLKDSGDVEIVYSLAPQLWGRGLATEAAEAVLRYLFEELGLERVFGGADEPNRASARVLAKLGMRYHGIIEQDGDPVTFYLVTRAEFLEAERL
jgi:ribosomal-protein-alanine N-acetyltransferase